MRHRAILLVVFAALVGWTSFHLELTDSHPKAGQAMAAAPAEIRLHFSVVPDAERSSFSVRGPSGLVELGGITPGESPKVLKASVTGAMPDGAYTVSWVGAPVGDHAVRGRYTFTVDGGG